MNRLCKNEVKYVKMLTKIFTLHTCILVQTSVSRSNKGMINVTLQSLRITTGFRMAFQQQHSLKGKNLIGHQKISTEYSSFHYKGINHCIKCFWNFCPILCTTKY
jgi:hypothetical protein